MACAITDYEDDTVIITGGAETTDKVSVYSKTGWKYDLKSFNQGRIHHGCTSYVSDGKKVNVSSFMTQSNHTHFSALYGIWRRYRHN